jgi:tetratricopeptide (TPR) repeat protein
MRSLFRILYVFAVFTASSLQAQDAGDIQGLLKDLRQAKADTSKVFFLAQLSFNYTRANPDSSLLLGNEALALAQKINYKRGLGDAYNSLGWAYFCKGNYDTAKILLNKAIEIFSAMNSDLSLSKPLVNLGNIYIEEGDYIKALSSFQQALEKEEKAGDEEDAGRTLFNIGRVYNLQKNGKEARKYFQQAVDIHKKNHDDLYMAQALSSIGNTYQFEGKYDTALIYYKQVIPIFSSHNDLYRTGNTYENISVAYQNKNQYQEAIAYMEKANSYYTKIDSKLDMAYANSGLGEIYNHLGNTKLALFNYNKALEVARQMNSKDLERSVLLGLSDVYANAKDFKKAYYYFDSSNNIKDSLFTIEKQSALLELQTKFETERKEKENQVLKANNEAATAQLHENKILLTAATAGLLMLAVLLYILYRNRQTKIKNIVTLNLLNAQLQEQKEAIGRYNTLLELKALRAQMNPHFIFNCMSSIQECMLMGRLDEANTYLSKLSRLLRMVLVHSDDENISLEKELEYCNYILNLNVCG